MLSTVYRPVHALYWETRGTPGLSIHLYLLNVSLIYRRCLGGWWYDDGYFHTAGETLFDMYYFACISEVFKQWCFFKSACKPLSFLVLSLFADSVSVIAYYVAYEYRFCITTYNLFSIDILLFFLTILINIILILPNNFLINYNNIHKHLKNETKSRK